MKLKLFMLLITLTGAVCILIRLTALRRLSGPAKAPYPCQGFWPPVLTNRKVDQAWINAQVAFWYGDLYSLVLEGQWGTIKRMLLSSPYGTHAEMLDMHDTTEDNVQRKYRDFAAYRHKDNAAGLCDFLRHAPHGKWFSATHRFPILLVDCIGENQPVISLARSVNPGEEMALLWPNGYLVSGLFLPAEMVLQFPDGDASQPRYRDWLMRSRLC